MRSLALAAILLTNAAFVGDRAPRIAAGRQPRTARVLVPATAPAGWRALRDRDTGAIVQLWGGSVAAPGASADPAIAERAARAFLAVLAPGANPTDFVLAANRLDGDLRTVAFQQTVGGLRVVGGQLFVVFGHDRLFAASSNAVPVQPIAIAAGPHPNECASVRTHPGTRRAASWLGATAACATGERVVLPMVYGPSDIVLRVADVIDATAQGERWTVYVSPEGEPLLRESRIAKATSTLRFDAGDRRPTGTRSLVPASRANLTVAGVSAVTADDGTFTTGNTPTAVGLTATGALVRVQTAAGLAATASKTAQPGQPVDFSLATDELGDAQVSAYIYVTGAKARARVIEPGLAWLDQEQVVTVNETGECNAFSTGDDLHFFRGSTSCENTGRLADVVRHEFGHSLHFQSIIPGAGAFDIPMSEGLADFFAANITGDPGIGRGLHFDDTAIRDLDPLGLERRYPEDISSDSHTTGLIMGGALWDLRTALIAELGTADGITATERIYLGILQRSADIPNSYLAALIADDDDFDLGNGTPHQCTLEAAFGPHGLVTGLVEANLGTPAVDGRAIAVTVTPASGSSCPHPQIATLDLVWQIGDGAPQTIAMTAAGDTWSASIPEQPAGTVVLYQIIGHLDDGSQIVRPDNLADPRYQMFIGEATPIWCDRLDRDPQWTQTGTPSWEWARPFGHAGDPPVPFTGDAFLGTNITRDGRYPSDAMTGIVTPSIDASGFDRVHLQFHRWLTVEDRAHDVATVDVNGSTMWTNATGVDHIDREWRFVDLEIPPGDVQIGWTITSDQSTELGGWNLDDVCVVGLGGPTDCPTCPTAAEAGCCSTSRDARGSLLLGAAVLVLVVRRRKPLLQ